MHTVAEERGAMEPMFWPSLLSAPFFVSLDERRLCLIHLSRRPLRHLRRRLVAQTSPQPPPLRARHSLTLPRYFYTAAFHAMAFLFAAVSIPPREVCIQGYYILEI